MSSIVDQTPFYKRLTYWLLGIVLLGYLLYVSKEILVPFVFATMLASLLLPVNRFFERKGIPRALAISISLAFSLVVIGSVMYLLASQIVNFMDDLPLIQDRWESVSHDAQKWFRSTFGVTIRQQNQYLNESASQMKGSQGVLQQTYATLTDLFSYLIMLPIYSALILYYRDMIKKFLVDVFTNGEPDQVMDILLSSQSVSQRFIIGLLIETSVVFVLNATGFLILGIKYAIFLALVSAILNLIPYLGMLVANMFSMLVTLVSSEVVQLSDVLWVGAILAVVQFIDNNFLMPFIIGSKVRINPLAMIMGVLIGGALCGVAGMFLSIPGLAVLKVIFDRVERLKAYGMLLGDNTMANKVLSTP